MTITKVDIRFLFPRCKAQGVCLPVFQPKVRRVRDFFEFSAQVYKPFSSNTVYEKLESCCLAVEDDSSTGYYGAAFLDLRIGIYKETPYQYKLTTKPCLIIAHRGTEPYTDFFNDILYTDKSIARQEIPLQFYSACNLVFRVWHYLGVRDVPTIHTGHSLGAALAQMCGHKFKQRSKGFETPGTQEILMKIDPYMTVAPDQHISFSMWGSYISHISSKINLLPFIGRRMPHVGKVFQCVKSYEDQSLINPYKNIKNLHLLENMEPCINSDGNFVPNPKKLQ